MTEYNLLWEKVVDELMEVDVDINQVSDVAGWFYLRGANLSEEQKERLLATLPDDHLPCAACVICNVCRARWPRGTLYRYVSFNGWRQTNGRESLRSGSSICCSHQSVSVNNFPKTQSHGLFTS